MSREDIVAIAVRLFALFLVVIALRVGAQAIGFTTLDGVAGVRAVLGSAVVTLVLSGLAALLWVFPLSVARKLLPVMKEPRSEPAAGAGTLFSLAVALMGLWLLSNGIIDIVYWSSLLAAMRQQEVPFESMPPETTAGMVATGFEIVLGITMLLGSNRIRDLTQRLRHANTGTAQADEAPAPRAGDAP